MSPIVVRQPLPLLGLLLAAFSATCGGHSSGSFAPAAPEAAVRSFMNAVKANSLVAMGQLWGSSRGPASKYMERSELEKRLTVIRSFLEHEQFEIVEVPAEQRLSSDGRRTVQVRLTRKGCQPLVPFSVAPYRSGWLITEIDLAAAGNPARRCAPGQKQPALF